MKTAFLFPGQGSQFVGMGKDIYEKYEEAKQIYDRASQITGSNIKKLCFEQEQAELNKTENAQIAILVTSLAIAEVLKSKKIEADMCAGLSLGEYTALIYSGYLSFEEGVQLVKKRGYFMQHYLPKEQFKMAAIMGIESRKVEEICTTLQKQGMFVVPANYNYKLQTVISGNEEAVEKAEILLKEKGAKKIIELKTSGPFHTQKLEKAKEAFEKELQKVKFETSKQMVIRNIDGKPYKKEDNMQQILANHMVSPVRFDREIAYMQNRGIDLYIEVGPGKTLTSFIKKENKEVSIKNVCSVEELEDLLYTIT